MEEILVSLVYIWLLICELELAMLDIAVFAAFVAAKECDVTLFILDISS